MAHHEEAAPPPDGSCPFCTIASSHPILAPSPPPAFAADRTSPAAFLVLSAPLCMAFLDIMPLARGHLLVTTRAHHEKLSDVGDDEAKELGRWCRVLSRALARESGVWDWNIVQNNGAAAAQVVPHVHFHIIPRPALTAETRNRSFTMFGRGQRSELDEDEAEALVQRLRIEVAKEVESEGRGKL